MKLRLLIIRRRYLGDLVLFDPALRSLRETYPGSFIALLVDQGYENVLATHPAPDRILVLPRRQPGESAFGIGLRYLALARELRSLRFDTCVDYQPNVITELFTACAGAARRIAFVFTDGSARRRLRINVPVPATAEACRTRHILRNIFEVCKPLHIPFKGDLHYTIPSAASDEAEGLLRSLLPDRGEAQPLPYVLVHPGARLPARRWPAASFAAAVAALRESGRAHVVVVQGGGEEELVREIARLVPGVPHLIDPLPLPVFAALAAKAAVYLGNDTGPMHLAAATGTRVIALFGAQSSVIWHPVGNGNHVIHPPLPCGDACVTPDQCDRSNDYRMHCIRRIPVDEVTAVVLRSLDELADRSRPPA